MVNASFVMPFQVLTFARAKSTHLSSSSFNNFFLWWQCLLMWPLLVWRRWHWVLNSAEWRCPLPSTTGVILCVSAWAGLRFLSHLLTLCFVPWVALLRSLRTHISVGTFEIAKKKEEEKRINNAKRRFRVRAYKY